MSLRVERSSQAPRDILRIADWYETNVGLAVADRFVAALEAAIKLLTDNPFVGAIQEFGDPRLAGMRRWRLKRFPL